jgi:hypothetical protein
VLPLLYLFFETKVKIIKIFVLGKQRKERQIRKLDKMCSRKKIAV